MSTHSLNFLASGAGQGALDCHESLSRFAQVRCHLICAGQQIAHLRLSRVGFHFRGIARAIGIEV